MSNLTDIDKASLEESLRNNGEIYPIPMNTENNEYTYQTASEYLSGDIYAKLDTAESYAAVDNIYRANVTALKAALPTPLKAGDIDVNLGATWIAPEYYEKFMYKLFETLFSIVLTVFLRTTKYLLSIPNIPANGLFQTKLQISL